MAAAAYEAGYRSYSCHPLRLDLPKPGRYAAPLRCVKRVRRFELLSDTPAEGRLPVRIDLDVEGLGPWQHDLAIYMPTREQMDERARILAERPSLAQG
jgi:hypothetical protein